MSPRFAITSSYTAALFCGVVSVAATKVSPEPSRTYNLPRGDASTTLRQLAGLLGRQILFLSDKLQGEQTNAISGQYTAREAIDRMLAGTSLVALEDETTGGFVVSRRTLANPPGEVGHDQPQPLPDPMTPSNTSGKIRAWLVRLALAATTAATAQQAQESPTAKEGEVVVLSPFVIQAENETSYRATSTLAGTRINTSLRDVGSAISVLTKELFEDTGANDASSVLSYALNMEVGGAQGNFAGSDFVGGRPDMADQRVSPQDQQRTRGLASASLTRSYFLTDIPFDTYNTSSVTINRGPNSLLFGIGSPGGVINNDVNRPLFGKDFGSVALRLSERGSYRTTFDYNWDIIPRRLAVRLDTLYDKMLYQQRPAMRLDRRYYGAIEGVLAENKKSQILGSTTIRANMESGKIKGTPPNVIPPGDGGITTWFASADPALQEITGTVFPAWVTNGSFQPKFTVENRFGANYSKINGSVLSPYFIHNGIYYNQPGSQIATIGQSDGSLQGIMARMAFNTATSGPNRGRPLMDLFATQHFYAGSFTPGFVVPVILDRNVFDNERNLLAGNTNYANHEFGARNIVLEQLLFKGNAGLELAWDSQNYDSEYQLPFTTGGLGGASSASEVVIDLSQYLGNGEPNPNLGRPMIKDSPFGGYNQKQTDREAFTATGFYRLGGSDRDKGLQWLGRHVFTGFYSRQKITTRTLEYGSAWESESTNIETNHQGILNNFRRQVVGIVYVGDSLLNPAIQSYGDVRLTNNISVPVPQAGDKFKISYYDRATGTVRTSDDFTVRKFLNEGELRQQHIESKVLSWQGHFLKDHLVALFGWRRDAADSYEQAGVNRLPDGVFDPENLKLKPQPSNSTSGNTVTWSLVGHLPEKVLKGLPYGANLSAHYNVSENFSPSTLRRNSYGSILPAPQGQTKEYGFTIDLLNHAVSMRFNWFNTKSEYADAGLGNSVVNASNIVSFWMSRWMAARDDGQSIQQALAFAGGVQAANLWQSYDEAFEAFNSLLPAEVRTLRNYREENNQVVSNEVFGETATTTFEADGFEIDLTGNITPQWRVFLNVGKQETIQTGTALEARSIAETVMRNLEASGFAGFRDSPNLNEQETFAVRYNRQIFALASVGVKDGTVSAEQRKWRANLVTAYDFSDAGRLDGFSVGCGVRWQDKIATGYPLRLDNAGVQVPDLSRPFYGPDQLNGDVWVGYKRDLANGRKWEVQLNVRNAFGDNDPITVVTNPDGRVAVIRNANSQEVFLTNTIRF